MTVEFALLITVLLAGFYMAWNIGANDVANAMGTSVGSGALTLRRAVILAAIFEFSGAFFFGSHVTETIQKGIVSPTLFENSPLTFVYGMLAALLAAGVWLQIASYFGWPVSTTHSIVGAVLGFGVIVGGAEAVEWGDVFFIIMSWIISPLFGGLLAFYIFSFLRDRIFFSSDPLFSAKKWAPVFTTVIILTFSLTLLTSGSDNFLSAIPLPKLIAAVIVICCFGFGLTLIWARGFNLSKDEPVNTPSQASEEVMFGLKKAKKHLEKAYSVSQGEMQYQIHNLLDEVNSLKHQIRQLPVDQTIHVRHTYVEKIFSGLQVLTGCFMAFAHGTNDVANAIGPLVGAVTVLQTGSVALSSSVPTWALALGGVGIVIGLATWGWRVIETIGKKITELTPTRGFSAEFAAALTVLIASRMGLPISATHTLIGAVLGVGLARGLESINLAVTRDILISWVVTVPAGAAFCLGFFYLIRLIFG